MQAAGPTNRQCPLNDYEQSLRDSEATPEYVRKTVHRARAIMEGIGTTFLSDVLKFLPIAPGNRPAQFAADTVMSIQILGDKLAGKSRRAPHDYVVWSLIIGLAHLLVSLPTGQILCNRMPH